MNILDSGIEVYGLSDNIPSSSMYFKEFDFQVTKKIDNINSQIEKILSINTNINIGEVDIIKTPIMISNDGLFFSGYKLKVELIIDIKIKYMLQIKALGLSRNKIIKTIYIVLPLEYKEINMIDLLRKRRIIINEYIEDIYCELRNENILYTNLSAIVIADFIEN